MLENVNATRMLKIIELESKEKELDCKQICDTCGNSAKTKCYLDEHVARMHEEESTSTTSKCVRSCEFESGEEKEIKKHKDSTHELSCLICDQTFKSKSKLKTHMCRLLVTNPTCGDYFTKNWIVAQCCMRIFSTSEESESLILHSIECFDNMNRCSDMPEHYDHEITNYDGYVWHAALKDYFSGGKICWEELNREFDIQIR